ncbi:prolipoprotein diacylglyceryl transferase [Microbacterium sp. X-17]|uniref:prolipoprotein diacylglyceryl transferase n=1 Tax=Microbacterium sp. X-17 TaxID=3144404 RepID=UPI0031F4E6EF
MPLVKTSIPSPPPEWSQFQIGSLTIHTYALCIIAGIVAAVWITGRRLGRRGVDPGFAVDATLWAVPLGIICARFYHVFTHVGDYFFPGANLWNVFAIWDGGNAIYGALIGGAVGVLIVCRRAGVRFWTFADALAPALLVAQSLGRFGNYFNHELFGLPTTLPWGLQIEATNPKFPPGLPAGTLFHPLFLYEIIWNLIGFAVLLLLERRFTLQWGKMLALYLIWYGTGRSYLESIRIDPSSDSFLGIPANVWASFVAVIVGVVLLIVQSRRHPGPEPSPFTKPNSRAMRKDLRAKVDAEKAAAEKADAEEAVAATADPPTA